MKKLAVLMLLLILVLSVLNFPLFLYSEYQYFNEDTIIEDITANIDFYESGDAADLYIRYYGEDITDLMNRLLEQQYTLIDKAEAFKILYFEDVDKISRHTSLPMFLGYDGDERRLIHIQIFELQNKHYIFCDYLKEGVSLYECTYDEKTANIFNRACFSEGKIKSNTEDYIKYSFKVTLKHFLPILIAALILFLPSFTEGKRSTEEARKLAKTMGKIGIILIPVLLIIVFLKLYL